MRWSMRLGHVPLPPYIKRADTRGGSRALPDRLRARAADRSPRRPRGCISTPRCSRRSTRAASSASTSRCTSATARSSRFASTSVEEHVVDPEPTRSPTAAARRSTRALDEGRRVIAVGTTTTRALEDAAAARQAGASQPGAGATDLFISSRASTSASSRGLLTNFHLPQSSLLMLVAAFAGRERVLARLPRGGRERLSVLQLRRRDAGCVASAQVGRLRGAQCAVASRRGASVRCICRRAIRLRRVRSVGRARPIRWRRARARPARRISRRRSRPAAAVAALRRLAARHPRRRATSRRSSRAMRARSATAAGIDLGTRRARDQDRSRAGPRRPDGARVRFGARDQRRRRHPRLRARARRARRRRMSTKRSAPAASAWPRKRDAAERRDQRRRRPRAGPRPGGRRLLAPRQPPFARRERARGGGAARDSGHRACRDRHRHHPHAPGRVGRGASAKAACATSATSSSNVARLERGVYLNCGSAVVLPEVFLKAVALARNQRLAARPD